PFRHAVALLSTMPGLSEVSAQVLIAEIGLDMSRFASAQVLIAEIGLDMSRFASADRLRSWACLCPRNDESAG
ncbi:transposase, partial [Achromobacter spanius]|uniref:transposase n=1 Tax=Achromobacter spanius TaxID=217203 RepID=UPI003209B059